MSLPLIGEVGIALLIILLVNFVIGVEEFLGNWRYCRTFTKDDFPSGNGNYRVFKEEFNKYKERYKIFYPRFPILPVIYTDEGDVFIGEYSFRFPKGGMYMSNPIEYWRCRRYVREYIREQKRAKPSLDWFNP